MTEQSYSVPPPPPPAAPAVPPAPPTDVPIDPGFHIRPTHLLMRIRAYLSTLEKNLPPSSVKNFSIGLIIALILGATLSVGLAFVFELPLGTSALALATIDPLFEEFFKGISMYIVVVFIWKTIPSRRYGALLGTTTGLGFAITENIIYSNTFLQEGNPAGVVGRWLGLPFTHVLWSAFIGVGLFVLLAQRKTSGTPSWLWIPVVLFGWIAHMIWNALSIATGAVGASVIGQVFVNIIVVSIPFAFLLRDLLGGHFNFQNFLLTKPVPPPPPQAEPLQQPPPPPPPPASS